MGIWEPTLVSMAVAKTNLSKIAMRANETGEPVMVLKGSRPWFEIRPLAYRASAGFMESGSEKRA